MINLNEEKSEDIIVTGGAGFIGSNFLRHMINKYPQHNFINIDKLSYAGNINNLNDISKNKNYKFVKEDICNRKAMEEIITSDSIIINFAAETHVDNSISGPMIFSETNIVGTHSLLEAARKKGAKLFVQISTDEVYGSLNFDSPSSKESDVLKPSSPYSSSKAAAEMLCFAYFHTFKMPIIITRSSNNFGPYQYPEKVIPLFITNLIEGKKVPLYGTGKNVRDWIFVQDNCEAIDFVIHRGKTGEIYNIGGGNEIKNIELTTLLLKSLGLNENSINYVADRLGHDLRYSVDCSKIHKLGWKPMFSFHDALKDTIEWYMGNREWWELLKEKANKKNNLCEYLILGNGYLGSRFKEYLGEKAVLSDKRISNEDDVVKLIEEYKPKVVINAIGHTGRPNVDACETQKYETWHGNVEIPLFIANACNKNEVFMVNLSSGCIYEGTGKDGLGFSEKDEPNFRGSYYSKTKAAAETLLEAFPKVLQVRLRIPLEGKKNQRNLIDKLIAYIDKGYPVLSAFNSISYIPDFLRITKELIDRRCTGVFNVVNDGAMIHEQLLRIYEKMTGKKLNYQTITPEQLDTKTIARRSNCILSVEKIKSLGIEVHSVESAIERAVEGYIKEEKK